MLRRPPRSTRTDTLFPYTTLFRSAAHMRAGEAKLFTQKLNEQGARLNLALRRLAVHRHGNGDGHSSIPPGPLHGPPVRYSTIREYGTSAEAPPADRLDKSDARRVGKECVRLCRSRWCA